MGTTERTHFVGHRWAIEDRGSRCTRCGQYASDATDHCPKDELLDQPCARCGNYASNHRMVGHPYEWPAEQERENVEGQDA